MDRKLARENIRSSFDLLGDLNHGRFGHAKKDILKMEKNLHYIKTEISSGEAKREYKERKH